MDITDKIEKHLNERKVTDKMIKSDVNKAWVAVSNLIKNVNSWEGRDNLPPKTKSILNKLLSNMEQITSELQ